MKGCRTLEKCCLRGTIEEAYDVMAALDPVLHVGEAGDVVRHDPQVLATGPAGLAGLDRLCAGGQHRHLEVGREAVLHHIVRPAHM